MPIRLLEEPSSPGDWNRIAHEPDQSPEREKAGWAQDHHQHSGYPKDGPKLDFSGKGSTCCFWGKSILHLIHFEISPPLMHAGPQILTSDWTHIMNCRVGGNKYLGQKI